MRIKPVALIALRRLVGKRRVSQKDNRLFWSSRCGKQSNAVTIPASPIMPRYATMKPTSSFATLLQRFFTQRLMNPVAAAIAAWDGTTTQLWRELQARDQTEARPTETKGWPKDPVSFGIALAKTLPTLRKIGVEATRDRLKSRKRTPMLHLRRIEQEEQPQHWAPEGSERSEGLASNRALAKIIPFP